MLKSCHWWFCGERAKITSFVPVGQFSLCSLSNQKFKPITSEILLFHLLDTMQWMLRSRLEHQLIFNSSSFIVFWNIRMSTECGIVSRGRGLFLTSLPWLQSICWWGEEIQVLWRVQQNSSQTLSGERNQWIAKLSGQPVEQLQWIFVANLTSLWILKYQFF